MVNTGVIYFTSRTFRHMFVLDGVMDDEAYGWTLVNFLIFVIVIEHSMLILKIFIEQIIEDVPHFVVKGERERTKMVENFMKAGRVDEGQSAVVTVTKRDRSPASSN